MCRGREDRFPGKPTRERKGLLYKDQVKKKALQTLKFENTKELKKVSSISAENSSLNLILKQIFRILRLIRIEETGKSLMLYYPPVAQLSTCDTKTDKILRKQLHFLPNLRR